MAIDGRAITLKRAIKKRSKNEAEYIKSITLQGVIVKVLLQYRKKGLLFHLLGAPIIFRSYKMGRKGREWGEW